MTIKYFSCIDFVPTHIFINPSIDYFLNLNYFNFILSVTYKLKESSEIILISAQRSVTIQNESRLGAFPIFHVCLQLVMKPLQKKPTTIRKQLSSSNLFMSDMLFLMKALAAPHNQLPISQLIFHPAIVMSSAGAGIIHNSPSVMTNCGPGPERYMNAFGSMSSPCHLCGNNGCWLVAGCCEIRADIKQQIGQSYLNRECGSQMNGFTDSHVPPFPLLTPPHTLP